ncbi:uncharacterized protein LOC122022815 [Zingiber officinale]|uniref:uncharacterized protein LOC122022815 n=1 Tax=Zingiber officinale TaxID=94328 RepID=UPI001C4CA6D9|nr:uncharacterized protein LOC122022815 [Zingiber officinale]
MSFPPQNFQGFGNSMNHLNYAPRGPYQPLPAKYWQNMSHPYFTSSVVHGYGTPLTTGMSFTPLMSNEPVTLTFVPETQLSNRESPIEVTNLEKAVSNAEGTRKRSSWTKVEDEVLARSFVTISDDPIIDNDKKADAFWGRVASYYNENLRLSSNTRSANVIRGHSDEDILRFAYEKYRSENNDIAFNLEHVWRIVKDRPMFTSQFVDHIVATKKTRTSESGASNTSSNQDMSIDLDYEDTRPMGQNTAKRKGKDKVKSTMEDLTVNYNNIITKFTEYTSVKKSEVDLKQKQLEVEEIKAKAALSKSEAKNRRLKLKEYEILNKGTSQMTKEQLIIHKCLCQDIRDDVVRRKGLSPLQKCTATISQLAYGVPADHLDEYLRMGESTAIKYLRRSNADDVQCLLQMHDERHGFPDMLDRIYPEWATFVKAFPCPEDPKRKLFKERQESVRKDVKRAFGVLQSRWAIVRGPARYWYRKKLKQIMLACIILHNMIVEDEGGHVTNWYNDEGDEPAQSIHGSNRGFQDYLRTNSELRDIQFITNFAPT